jgi:hypothetical protein
VGVEGPHQLTGRLPECLLPGVLAFLLGAHLLDELLLEGPVVRDSRVLGFLFLYSRLLLGFPLLFVVLAHLFQDFVFLFERHPLALRLLAFFRHVCYENCKTKCNLKYKSIPQQ